MTDEGMVSVPLSWSEQYEELKAERDRLREAIDADRPMQISNLKALIAERDRLRTILDTLSTQAVEAEGQENVDDYDQGNVDAWRYVRLYIERELR